MGGELQLSFSQKMQMQMGQQPHMGSGIMHQMQPGMESGSREMANPEQNMEDVSNGQKPEVWQNAQ